jgi:hypothetical protein
MSHNVYDNFLLDKHAFVVKRKIIEDLITSLYKFFGEKMLWSEWEQIGH